jgi:hypothetical protein
MVLPLMEFLKNITPANDEFTVLKEIDTYDEGDCASESAVIPL